MASAPKERAGRPAVSVIMPVRNEAPHLRASVSRVLADPYDGDLEIVLAVGPSSDGTERIAAEIAAESSQVVVVPNPSGRTPVGLNAAIAASRHEILVRVDGHGFLPAGYVDTAVTLLEETGAANVGGRMVPAGTTPFEEAAAWAMSSRFGIGGGRFHVGGKAGPVETVYLGVFRRSALIPLGGFDEHFTRAQDWELNYRIRRAGGLVWFDPRLQVVYRPRPSLRALARQFHGSGRWRREVLQKYPETASMRYLAPPIALTAIVLGLAAGLIGYTTGPAVLRTALVLPVGYLAVVLAGTAVSARSIPVRAVLRVPAVLVWMHMTWAAGFLRGTRTRAASPATGTATPA